MDDAAADDDTWVGKLEDAIDSARVPETRAQLLALLKSVSWPVIDASQAPATKGHRIVRAQFGLAGRRMQKPTLSLCTKKLPMLTRLLFGFLKHVMPHASASSATVAFHRHARLHADTMNLGPSWATALAATSGGDLWICDGTNQGGQVLRTSERFCEFNSQYGHRTLPFTGPRFYVSFYTHRSARRASRALRQRLLKHSVPFPSHMELKAWKLQSERLPTARARLRTAQNAWRRHLRTHPEHRITWKRVHWVKGSWVCRHCGKFGVAARGRNKKFCSHACRSAAWRVINEEPAPVKRRRV